MVEALRSLAHPDKVYLKITRDQPKVAPSPWDRRPGKTRARH
jgi:hypothetical protein